MNSLKKNDTQERRTAVVSKTNNFLYGKLNPYTTHAKFINKTSAFVFLSLSRRQTERGEEKFTYIVGHTTT